MLSQIIPPPRKTPAHVTGGDDNVDFNGGGVRRLYVRNGLLGWA
jgi:hypothetical protein